MVRFGVDGVIEGRRILLFAQNFSGAGHFVRSLEIARALAAGNDVYLASGGEEVPRPESRCQVQQVGLPAIHQRFGEMTALEPGLSLDETKYLRAARLYEIVGELVPDVVLVEHFPFSKWDIASDTIDLIQRARQVNPEVRILSSVRDIPPGREDPVSAEHDRRRLEMLNAHFHAALVHADPRVVRLEEHIRWAADIRVPVHYTGYVSEKVEQRPQTTDASPQLLLSCGGDGWLPVIETTLAAWNLLANDFPDGKLDVMLPLYLPNEQRQALISNQAGRRVGFHEFETDFLSRLQAADLSISHAGYNTCANLLETRKRAILIPHPVRYDQPCRAQRFGELGLFQTLTAAEVDPRRLADTIRDTLAGPAPHHQYDLNGAANTCELLAELMPAEA